MLFWSRRRKRHHTFKEKVMADFTKLMADLADLSAKFDAFVASHPPPVPPVDEQPQVDAADAAVQAITAKIPA